MRVGIYVDVARETNPTGIGLHVRNLLSALAAIDDQNEFYLYYQRGLIGRDGGFPLAPSQRNFHVRPVRFPERWKETHPTLWWNLYLPQVLAADRIDVFHGPNHFLPTFARDRSVLTIHDLAYFRTDTLYPPEFTSILRRWTLAALGRAAAIIALSENTRRDLEWLGVERHRVRVIYGGAHVVPESEIRFERGEELRRNLKLPACYFLFVGTLQPRKNVPLLLRAFAAAKKSGAIPEHGLVLVGQRDSAAAEIFSLIRDLGIESDVVITGYVEEWQLPLLYKMADVFVLPTLYEGFTLVTLEAMSYGVPVIATDNSSLRESVGDAAVLVAEEAPLEMADAMKTLVADRPRREWLIKAGKVQASKFTWERCARDTRKLYDEVNHSAKSRMPLKET